MDTLSSDQIITQVQALQDTTILLLSDLVRLPSFNGTKAELDAQIHVEKLLREAGFQTKRVPLAPAKKHPKFSPVDWNYDNRFNVVGTWNPHGETKGSSLAISGHIDVVPVEQETQNQWKNNPFDPVVENGRLFGRGAGDMKGGWIAGFIAFLALRKLGYEPAARLEFHSVLEEECTGNGALALVLENNGENCADAVLIPEPLPGILSAQLGVMWCSVTVSGKPVHVLDTAAGINAIEGCYTLWQDLKLLEHEWNELSYRKQIPGASPYEKHPHPINFNLGKINGGAWASSVPSSCSMEFRVGFFPGQTIDEIKAKLEAKIETCAKLHSITFKMSYSGFQAEGVYSKGFEDSTISTILSEAHQIVVGSPAQFNPATCTTDVRAYAHNSPSESQRMNVTCYGPEAKNIHGIDESVCLKSINQVAAVYALFIQKHCSLNHLK